MTQKTLEKSKAKQIPQPVCVSLTGVRTSILSAGFERRRPGLDLDKGAWNLTQRKAIVSEMSKQSERCRDVSS